MFVAGIKWYMYVFPLSVSSRCNIALFTAGMANDKSLIALANCRRIDS